MKINPLFKVGEKVRVVNYGHLLFTNEPYKFNYKLLEEKGSARLYDVSVDLLGKTGDVTEVCESQGKFTYALSGLRKVAWYNEDQLEKVLKRI